MGLKVSMPAIRRGPWEEGLTHRIAVMRLYRQSLRTAQDWYPDWFQWEQMCQIIEKEFKANKYTTLEEGKLLFEEGKRRLWDMRHAQPYIKPWMAGGTLYQRNVPPPIEWCDTGALPPPRFRTWK